MCSGHFTLVLSFSFFVSLFFCVFLSVFLSFVFFVSLFVFLSFILCFFLACSFFVCLFHTLSQYICQKIETDIEPEVTMILKGVATPQLSDELGMKAQVGVRACCVRACCVRACLRECMWGRACV